MILDYSRVIVYTVGAGVAFFLGYSVASNKCQIKIQEKTIAEEQAINDNLQSAIHINNKIQNEVYHVTEDLYLSLADVDNEYSLIKSTPVISSYSGLSINTTGQDNKTRLSSACRLPPPEARNPPEPSHDQIQEKQYSGYPSP